MATKKSYVNGSDLLIKVGGKAIGHCTTHSIDWNTETKDVAVKPKASEPVSDGQWKNKRVTAKSASVNFSGLRFFDEDENGYVELLKLYDAGASIEVEGFERGASATPTPQRYFSGNFVITSLKEDAPAQDDATYSGTLENDGPVVIDESKLTTGQEGE